MEPTENRTQLPFAQHHAFIIGIDNYTHVTPLQTAVNDARKLAEVLAAQQHFLVHPPLLNAKREEIRTLLKHALPEKVGKDDRVLFYFAGHGIAADGEDGPAGYLVPADADPSDVESYIPMEHLHERLSVLPCRHLMLILDCCFSGAFKWSSSFRAIGTFLLIDPYEELLTRCSNEESRRQFTAVLKRLLEATSPESFKLIITVRADFETHFDHGELAKYWQPGRYTVPWFTVEELKEVIVMPTLQEVLIFDPAELVDEIINEVIQEPGALPLLSYTLSELYEAYVKSGRQDRALKKEDYDQLGGVMGALRTKADHLYHGLDPSHQRTMRKIMLRMVASEGELAGRRVLMDELIYDDPTENQRVDTVIQKLVETRLVVKGQDTVREREFVEPAHDALVRAWKTLLDWIQAVGKEKIALQDRLKVQVQEYERLKRNENVLWDNDPRLDLMKLELADSERNWLNKKERDFIQKSAAVKERKRKHRTLRWAAIIASLSLLAVVASVYAFRVSVLKYYDDHFSLAKQFEEKGGSPLENQGSRELQKSWLYTLLALGEDVSQDKKLTASYGRLIRQGVAAGAYQQLWCSPGILSDINDIAFSPDGKLLAIAGNDGTVRLGDMQTGVEHHALHGHNHSVMAVAFSPDGRWLASASLDSTIRLWEVTSASHVQTIVGTRGGVLSLAFSPDGKWLASAAGDSVIRIWNFLKGQPGSIIRNQSMGALQRVAYSPDGRYLASASADQTVRVWDLSSHSIKHQFAGESFAFSPDGKWITISNAGGSIRLCELRTGAEQHSFSGHRASVTAMVFSPGGKWLASAAQDSTMRIWDLSTRAPKVIVHTHRSIVQRLVFSPGQINWLVSASSDRSLRLWNVETGKELAAIAGHRNKINAVVFSETDRIFASGSEDGSIIIWEAATGRQWRRLEGHQGPVLSLEIREAAGLLVSGGADGTIRLWNLNNDSCRALAGHLGAVNSVVLDPDMARAPFFVISGSDDKTIRQWKIADGSSVVIGEHNDRIKSVAIERSGTRLAASAGDGTISLWDLQNGKSEFVVRWYAHGSAVNALAFNRPGTRLASASDDDEVRLWDVRPQGALVEFFKKNPGPLQIVLSRDVTFTLNERSLRDLRAEGLPPQVLNTLARNDIKNQPVRGETQFSEKLHAALGDTAFQQHLSLILRRASRVGTAKLVAYQMSGAPTQELPFLQILRGHEDDVLSVAFSDDADSRFLASGSSDETVRIWEVGSGSKLAVLSGHQNDVHSVAFNHDSTKPILASASWDNSVRLWDVEESCNLDHPFPTSGNIRAVAMSPDGQRLATVRRQSSRLELEHQKDDGSRQRPSG
ncbi:MAG: caspase family protein [bacterium]